jgi:hypothetical protein
LGSLLLSGVSGQVVKITRDEAFEKVILDRMAAREFKERTGTHCSDLCYCLNKQAMRRLKPAPTSRQELLRYSRGWATQRWLTGSFEPEQEFEVEGIKVTPDTIVSLGVEGDLKIPWELKSTDQSSTRPIEENAHWLRQIMAQCYVCGVVSAKLSRLENLGDWRWVYGKKEEKKNSEHPTLTAYNLEFTREEIEANWRWLQDRKVLFEAILATGKLLPKALALPPAQEFECRDCPYKGECPK